MEDNTAVPSFQPAAANDNIQVAIEQRELEPPFSSSSGLSSSGLTEINLHDDHDTVQDNAFDYRGQPASKSKTGNWKACFRIFGCEVCERVAYYAIASNLVNYLRKELHESVSESARNVNNWAGTTFLTPLLGAFVADAFLGRHRTLSVFLCGYILALTLVTLAVSLPSLKPPSCQTLPDNTLHCPPASSLQVGFFYFSLYLMALGAGGIKSNVTAFAGDQFDANDAVEGRRKMSFLNWWFVSISFGAMMSVTVLVYMEDNLGWSWGYGAATIVAVIASIIFFTGHSSYRHQKPSGSPLTRVAQVFVASTKKMRTPFPEDYEVSLYDVFSEDHKPKLAHTKGFAFLDKAAVVLPSDNAYHPDMKPNPWRLCPVTQIEEVKLLLKVLPIWITNLMYSTVFSQVSTFYLSQGTTMDRRLGPHFEIPASSFALFITLTICSLMPVYDKVLVPFLRRMTGNERGLTILQRIGVGQFVSIFAVGIAALVERRRLGVARDLGLLDAPGAKVPMSVFWLLPQYIITGICEVFISVGQMEFFYDQAPDTMRSVGAALYLSTISVGCFISGLLVSLVSAVTRTESSDGWIGNNLNRSHVDYFYWLLTIMSAVNFVFYLICAKWYTYKNVPVQGVKPAEESSGVSLSTASSISSVDQDRIISCVTPLSSKFNSYKELRKH